MCSVFIDSKVLLWEYTHWKINTLLAKVCIFLPNTNQGNCFLMVFLFYFLSFSFYWTSEICVWNYFSPLHIRRFMVYFKIQSIKQDIYLCLRCLGINRLTILAQGPLRNMPVYFHNRFISQTLKLHFQSSMHLLFCCCYICCGIVFLCQASTSLSLHPDGLACCTEALLQYVSLDELAGEMRLNKCC